MPAKLPSTPLSKPYNVIVILDTGPQFTAAEAELRLRTIAGHHLKNAALPPIVRVSALEATPIAAAMALYRAWRAVGKGAPALYVCAPTDTSAQLTLLTTDWGNTVLAPNDGTLGVIARLFTERRIPYTLYPLNLDKVIDAERIRMQNPDWEPAPDCALRDLLAPAAGLQLAGKSAVDTASPQHLESLPFAENSHSLRLKLNDPQTAYALPLGQGNEYLLNLTTEPLSFDQLLDDDAQFTIEMPGVQAPGSLSGLFGRPTVGVAPAPESRICAFKTCAGVLGIDGTLAPAWDERFLTLTLNTPLPPTQGPIPLTLTRQK